MINILVAHMTDTHRQSNQKTECSQHSDAVPFPQIHIPRKATNTYDAASNTGYIAWCNKNSLQEYLSRSDATRQPSSSTVYGQEMAFLLLIPSTTTRRTEVSKKCMQCC